MQGWSLGLVAGLAAGFLLAGEAVAFQNVIRIQPAQERLWQCGSNFPPRGAENYRYVQITVDGEVVADYDLMSDEDCRRVTTVVRDVPDSTVITVRAKVGEMPPMAATLTTRDWARLWTVNFYVDQIWGEVTEDNYAGPETEDGTGEDDDESAGGSGWTIPGGEGEQQVTDIWNNAACNYTDRAEMLIDRPMFLTRIQLWVDWNKVSGEALDYRVALNGEPAGGGTLTRGDCDPYQANWCTADDAPQVKLVPGRYTIRIEPEAICQNPESQGQGFIRAWDP